MSWRLIPHYPRERTVRFLKHKPPSHLMVIPQQHIVETLSSIHLQSPSLLVEKHTAHKWRQSDYYATGLSDFLFQFVVKNDKFANANFNRPYSRYPPSLKALEIEVEFVCSRQQKWRTYNLKDGNVKLWVDVIIVTFLDAVATIDLLKAIMT